MDWSAASRGLADLLVHADEAGSLSVAVFGSNDAERAEFCAEARREVDALLAAHGARVDIDLRKRSKEWVWSAAMAGVVDGVGAALKARGGAPGEGSAGHRAFHDLSIVERAVAAARKAAKAAADRIPDLTAVVGEAIQDLDVARQRRAGVEEAGTDVAEEVAQRDPAMAAILADCRALAGVLGFGRDHTHAYGLPGLVAAVGGPHKRLWRAVRFALGTGGLWVLLGVLIVVYSGVLAWELLPVTHWIGPSVEGVDMRPVAAVISWITVFIVLSPGYRRASELRRLAAQGASRWAAIVDGGRDLLDEEIRKAEQALAKAEQRLATTQRIRDGVDVKVTELQAGVGLGGFIGRLLSAQGGSMERWARTFDAARLDIGKALERLKGDPRSPVRRVVLFVDGLDERRADATDSLGVMRFLGSLPGVAVAAPVEPEGLRVSANIQRDNPRIDKALMFMEGDAKEFVAPLPPQEALDRSFHMGVFQPHRVAGGVPAAPASGPLPGAVMTGAVELSAKLNALAPDPHKQRRLVDVLRWVRCVGDEGQRANLRAMNTGQGGESDVQAVMLIAAILLGDPDHAEGVLNKLEASSQETFSKFIEQDVRPSDDDIEEGVPDADAPAEGEGEEAGLTKMTKVEADAWMGLCRKLLQVREHVPDAQSVELLQRWAEPVAEACASSLPLVHSLGPGLAVFVQGEDPEEAAADADEAVPAAAG